jgi:hypothetical protein
MNAAPPPPFPLFLYPPFRAPLHPYISNTGCLFFTLRRGAIKQAADDSRQWMGQSLLGTTFIGRLGTGTLAMLMSGIIVAFHFAVGLAMKLYFFSYASVKKD